MIDKYPLFADWTGEEDWLKPIDVAKNLRELLAQGDGQKSYFENALRHHFSSATRAAGVPGGLVARAMGHSNLGQNTFAKYSDIHPDGWESLRAWQEGLEHQVGFKVLRVV